MNPEAQLKSYDALVHKMTRRFCARSGGGFFYDDLCQVARMAVMRCAAAFDPGRGTGFAALAHTAINRALRRALKVERRRGLVRVLDNVKGRAGAGRVGFAAGAGGFDPLEQVAARPRAGSGLEAAEEATAALRVLTPLEREILARRLWGDEDFKTIGERYGVTGERIRQVEAQAIGKMRRRRVRD